MKYVLFSGGLDSLACLVWSIGKWGKENVMPIYFDFGQQYAEKEKLAFNKVCDILLIPQSLTVDAHETLVEDKETAYIPFRNTFLILMTAMQEDCDAIVFGMLQGSRTNPDTNPQFIKTMQKLLDSQTQQTPNQQGHKIQIYTPMEHFTKTEAVRWMNRKQNTVSIIQIRELIARTVGCYREYITPCGQCMSCFNRWVALENNYLSHLDTYQMPPYNWMLENMRHDRQDSPISGRPGLIRAWKSLGYDWFSDAFRAMEMINTESMLSLVLRRLSGKI